MTRRTLPTLLALACLAGPALAQEGPTGREREVLRTFIASFHDQLQRDVLPQFPLDAPKVQALFQSYNERVAGPLFRDGRGLATAAWRLKDELQTVLEADLATLAPHKAATPEFELLHARLTEVVELRKGDAFFAEQTHFATAMGRFRVRLESLAHLVTLAARSVGLVAGRVDGVRPTGTGDGTQRDPSFADLGG